MRLRFLVLGFLVTGSSMTAGGFERFDTGDLVFAACEDLTLFTDATMFSKPASAIRFGEQVRVTGLHHFFELPSTDYSSKEFLEKRELEDAEREERRPEPILPERYTRAAWLEFDQGFGPAACFVSEDLFASQTIEEAQSRVDALASGSAKRNFSEDEGGDMTAMRGAAGKAQGGAADFQTIDALIGEAQGAVTLEQLRTFRRQGQLGEFQ